MEDPSLISKNVSGHLGHPRESLGIFNVLGIMVFGIAVAVLVGLLLYKQYLGGRIETITEDLKKFEAITGEIFG